MNNWLIIGRIGKDAYIKAFQDGGKVANFNVAIDQQKKAADGSYEKTTLWVPVSLSNPSDKLAACLTKGTMLLIEGKPRARAYMQEGEAKPVLEMQAMRIELLQVAKNEDLPFAQ